MTTRTMPCRSGALPTGGSVFRRFCCILSAFSVFECNIVRYDSLSAVDDKERKPKPVELEKLFSFPLLLSCCVYRRQQENRSRRTKERNGLESSGPLSLSLAIVSVFCVCLSTSNTEGQELNPQYNTVLYCIVSSVRFVVDSIHNTDTDPTSLNHIKLQNSTKI